MKSMMFVVEDVLSCTCSQSSSMSNEAQYIYKQINVSTMEFIYSMLQILRASEDKAAISQKQIGNWALFHETVCQQSLETCVSFNMHVSKGYRQTCSAGGFAKHFPVLKKTLFAFMSVLFFSQDAFRWWIGLNMPHQVHFTIHEVWKIILMYMLSMNEKWEQKRFLHRYFMLESHIEQRHTGTTFKLEIRSACNSFQI